MKKQQLLMMLASILLLASCGGDSTSLVFSNYEKNENSQNPDGVPAGLELTLAIPQGEGELQDRVTNAIKEIVSRSAIAQALGAPEGENLQAIADNYEKNFKEGISKGELEAPCIYHLKILCQYSNPQCAVLFVSDGVFGNGGPTEYVWNVRLSDGQLMPYRDLFTMGSNEVALYARNYGDADLKEAINYGFENFWLAPDSAGCRVKVQTGTHFFHNFVMPMDCVLPYLTDEGKKMFGVETEQEQEQAGTAPEQESPFGRLLSTYRELYLKGYSSRRIEKEIRPVVEEMKQQFSVPVTGNPYGISCSKAVIDDYNVNDDCINIIMAFVPEEGTSFHLDGPSPIGGKIYVGPYGKSVRASMIATGAIITSRDCHCSRGGNHLLVTMIVKYDYLDAWKGLLGIELSESK